MPNSSKNTKDRRKLFRSIRHALSSISASGAGRAAIALIMTFIFGDLLLKRNYENFIAEQSEIREKIDGAVTRYAKAKSDLNELIVERRNQMALLTRYARSHELESFKDQYAEYRDVVAKWSALRRGLITRIEGYTGCERVFTDKERQLLDAVIFDIKRAGIFELMDVDQFVGEADLTNNIPVDFYCPSYHVFDVDSRRPKNESVSEIFLEMNNSYYESYHSTALACFETVEPILRIKTEECGRQLGIEAVRNCIANMIKIYEPKEFCNRQSFSKLAYFNDSVFDEVDYRWHVAVRLLDYFEGAYVRNECLEALGFWGRMFGWDCLNIARDRPGYLVGKLETNIW